MSEFENQSIEQKQDYLRREIMEKSYDPEEFVNFFQEHKYGDDFDLEYIRMEELREIVVKFQDFCSSGKQTEKKRQSIVVKNEKQENENKSYTTNIAVSEDNEVDEMLSCQKMEKSPFTTVKHLVITVLQPKLIKGGVFQSSYTVYPIKCSETNVEVIRRFRDFEWLFNELKHQFPGKFVPPIPEKQVFDNLNDSLINYRKRFFQSFLDHLVAIPIFKASIILHDFLTITDEKAFEKRKLEYQKMEGVYKLKDTRNLEGILYSKFNKEYSKQQKVLRDYVNINEILLSRLAIAYNNLKLDFEKISGSLINISEIYAQLKATSDEYFDPSPITDSYSMLEKLNKDWGLSYKKQINVFETDFKEYFEFLRVELDSMKEQISHYQDYKDEYLRYYNNLKNKKEKLFKTQALHKWEMSEEDLHKADSSLLSNKEAAFKLMCKKDSLVVEEKRRKLGVCCHSLLSDFFKVRSFHAKKFKNHFINLCGRNSEVLADVFGLVKLLHMNAQELKNFESRDAENENVADNEKPSEQDDNSDEYIVRSASIARRTEKRDTLPDVKPEDIYAENNELDD